jgi:hypothetical protein
VSRLSADRHVVRICTSFPGCCVFRHRCKRYRSGSLAGPAAILICAASAEVRPDPGEAGCGCFVCRCGKIDRQDWPLPFIIETNRQTQHQIYHLQLVFDCDIHLATITNIKNISVSRWTFAKNGNHQ